MKKEDVFNMLNTVAEEARNAVSGYEVVRDKVREYWSSNGVSDVLVLLRVEGHAVETIAFCESDTNFEEVTFDYDWWEGEPVEEIVIEHIVPLWEVLYDYRKEWEKWIENIKDVKVPAYRHKKGVKKDER